MNNVGIKNKQTGITLVEILIALVLGSFLLAGIYKIFLSSKQNYQMQENLARMQESGRFAMEFISRDLREADRRECYSDVSVGGEVFGFNNSGLNTSDVISLIQKDDACLVAANASTFSSIAFFIKADTTGAPALYRVTAQGQTVATASAAITTLIGAAGDVSLGTATAANALIEGIEDMQIVYGEDTDADGTANHYVDFGVVSNMDNVVSARVTLTVLSLDTNLVAGGDRRLRKTYSSTIGLRNRL